MASSSRHRKLALIIANSDYHRSENRLERSIENARSLGDSLKTIGFNVTTACNVEKHELSTCITDFAKIISHNDLIFFYFVGHGCQVKNKNYLIPVDDNHIERNRDIEDFAVDFQRILERIQEKNSSYVNAFILDCPGTYLFKSATSSNSASESKGLCEMKTMDGVLIQFACGINEIDRNHLFSKHLLKNIKQENIHIVDLFERIAYDVSQESNRRQRPLIMNGLQQTRDIYLNYVIPPPPPPPPKEPILTTGQFLTDKPLSPDEKSYYEDCKEYYRLTKQPLISVANEIFDKHTKVTSSLVFGIDEDCKTFELQPFLESFCKKFKLKMKDIVVKQIQQGSAIVHLDVLDKIESKEKNVCLNLIYHSLTDESRQELGKTKMFFMFLGPIEYLWKTQKHRATIKLNPQFNRKYIFGCDYWKGALTDGKNRGNKPYYCPVGWQRRSFYVTDNFNTQFHGWCIGYHGTKFAHGLSILLNGLKAADVKAHGSGVYLTPSVNYAGHPRYAEVKPIESSNQNKFFKTGKYVQFVLECRVHPESIKKIGSETLGTDNCTIDPNISNDCIEWLIDCQGESFLDFNDPQCPIVCTGVLTRITDNHPALLPESKWWFKTFLPQHPEYCALGIDFSSMQKLCQSGQSCNIVFD
ncbi:hypothetical protein I4U23_012326 [Adineta vaga]|nr:hypothetical protein I4U23_012326 [Adineta vaga]